MSSLFHLFMKEHDLCEAITLSDIPFPLHIPFLFVLLRLVLIYFTDIL